MDTIPAPSAPRASAVRRPVKTCFRCRRLKLKCDHNRPCRGCIRSNSVPECQYEQPEEDHSSPEMDAGYHSPSPQRKRRRAVRVCSRCRRLKLRCDQGKPCTSCVSAGVVEDGECAYTLWPGDEAKQTDLQELQDRIKSLEAQLSSLQSPQAYPSPPSLHRAASLGGVTTQSFPSALGIAPHVPPDPDVITLMGLFPPVDECRRLLRSFFSFDLLFRLVHKPSFMRRAEKLMAVIEECQARGGRSPATSPGTHRTGGASASVADDIGSSIPPDLTELSGFALLVATMLCGATISPQTATSNVETDYDFRPASSAHENHPHDPRGCEAHLRVLMDTVLAMCDSRFPSVNQLEYVHAHLISIYTHMAGRGGGPQRGWLACGRAYNAALLVGIHKEDRIGAETVFEREMRRRVWWQIVQIRLFIADRLRIDAYPEVHNVPRPLILSDDQLESIALSGNTPDPSLLVPRPDTVAEWAYVDSKLDAVMMFQRRDALMARTDIPLMERLDGAHLLLDEYAMGRATYLQRQNSATSNLPSWAEMQALVGEITLAEMYVHLYRTHFGSSEIASNGASIGSFALSRAMQASQYLVRAVRELTQSCLFGWLDMDTPVFALWTCGMKSFTGGMVLAYSLIANPDSPTSAADMRDFESTIGALRCRRNMPGSGRSNDRALATLEQLREIIMKKDRTFQHVVDPYTGKAVDMPVVLPDFAHGEWVEWETLFQELFQDGTVELRK